MSYHLNNWVLVKFQRDCGEVDTVVLGGTSGGFLSSDTWRMSSPIKSAKLDKSTTDFFEVVTSSGSHYKLPKEREQLHLSFVGIWNQLLEKYKERVQIIKMSDYLEE